MSRIPQVFKIFFVCLSKLTEYNRPYCSLSNITDYTICVGLAVKYAAVNLVQNSELVAKNTCITDVS